MKPLDKKMFFNRDGKFISVTLHAQTRVVQRFKLFMYPSEINQPELFLRREFNLSYRDFQVEMCPFYKRVLEQRYGKGAFFTHSQNLTFMCNELDDEIIIKTVIRRHNDWTPLL